MTALAKLLRFAGTLATMATYSGVLGYAAFIGLSAVAANGEKLSPTPTIFALSAIAFVGLLAWSEFGHRVSHR